MKPSGRVAEDHVGRLLFCSLDRIKKNRGRVCSFVAFNHRHAVSLAPDFQLLDGGRSKGIASAQHHLLSFVLKLVG